MARPNKKRRVTEMPKYRMFGPKGIRARSLEKVMLLIDEFEVFRLMDNHHMTQAEVAEQMGVARTTVQRIYNDARKKIAEAIVHGKVIVIEGGDYYLCEEGKDCLGRGKGKGRKQ